MTNRKTAHIDIQSRIVPLVMAVVMLTSVVAGVAFVGTQPIDGSDSGTATAAQQTLNLSAHVDGTARDVQLVDGVAYVADDSGQTLAIDTDTNTTLWAYPHAGAVGVVVFENYVVSVGWDGSGTIKRADKNGNVLTTFSPSTEVPDGIARSGNSYYASFSGDGVFKFTGTSETADWQFNPSTATTSVGANGSRVVVGGRDGNIWGVDNATGAEDWNARSLNAEIDSTDFGYEVKFQGDSAFISSENGVIQIDASTGNFIKRHAEQSAFRARGLYVTSDTIYAGSENETLYVIDRVDGVVANRTYHNSPIYSVDGGTADLISGSDSLILEYDEVATFITVTVSVEDENNDPVANAAVDLIQNGSVEQNTTTNGVGEATFEVVENSGEYTVEATKDGYLDDSATFTAGTQPISVQLTLEETQLDLDLQVTRYFSHAEQQGYTVVFTDAQGDRKNVTQEATVTSNDTSVLTVDSTSFTMQATSNESVAAVVNVTAAYNNSNLSTKLTDTKQITVANASVQNLQILPGIWRVVAVGEDDTLFVLLIATFLSVPAARFTSAFGGLAIAQLVMTIGWLAGYVGFGIAAVSLFVSMFIGLNLAANIEYVAGGKRQ